MNRIVSQAQTRDPREALVDELTEIAKTNPRLVVLDADVSRTTRSRRFRDMYPERFYDMGIAEQNLLGVAAGLASTGAIPVAMTFAVFASMRACEQLRTSICYPNLNVKVVGGNAGLSNSKDGATHQSLEDIAITRSIPNLVVMTPSDAILTQKIIRAAIEYRGPVYIRLEYETSPMIYDENVEFHIGSGYTLREGKDVTIVVYGIALARALEAADSLAQEGITCEVIDMPTLKPFNSTLLLNSVKKTGAVVTVEDHNIIGGIASAVCQSLVEKEIKIKFRSLGIKDTFAESGQNNVIRNKYGIGCNDIIEAARELSAAREK